MKIGPTAWRDRERGRTQLATGNTMRPGGLEPPTNSLEGCCSIHLSYGRGLTLRQFTLPEALVAAEATT